MPKAMALTLSKENFFWHKVHSATGIVPVGFYMLQHLTLNSFTLAGPDKFNGVLHFFESLPKHLLLAMEVLVIWIPLLFHAVYGLFIVNRGQANYFEGKYKWAENRMYTLQRWSGLFLFLFLAFHVATTTVAKYIAGSSTVIEYASWQQKLTSYGYALFIVYVIGVLAASYHLSYGVWNFCIRWGITISEKAQQRIQKFSAGMFVAVTLLGWAVLVGFLIHNPSAPSGTVSRETDEVTMVTEPRFPFS
jgi:succinate dehydrogenase / fumarate reductase cytochrome b subunit